MFTKECVLCQLDHHTEAAVEVRPAVVEVAAAILPAEVTLHLEVPHHLAEVIHPLVIIAMIILAELILKYPLGAGLNLE